MGARAAPRELLPLPLVYPHAQDGAPGLHHLARKVRSRVNAHRQLELAANEVVACLNGVYGRGDFNDQLHKPSLAQASSHSHIIDVVRRQGAPPCTAAVAFTELCGARPGYDKEPGPRASYQRELISLPSAEATLDGLGEAVAKTSRLTADTWSACGPLLRSGFG